MIVRRKSEEQGASTGIGAVAATSKTIDQSGATQSYTFTVTNGANGFDVTARGQTNGNTQSFSGISDLSVIGTIFSDGFVADAAALGRGATLTLDGGDGTDTAAIDLRALAVDLALRSDGSIRGNGLTLRNIETLTVTLGEATNTVVTGDTIDTINATAGGTDTINTGAGDDRIIIGPTGKHMIDGGAGSDTLALEFGDERSFTATLDVDAHTLNGSTYRNVEHVTLSGGVGSAIVLQGDLSAEALSVYYTRARVRADNATLIVDDSKLSQSTTATSYGPDYDNASPSFYYVSVKSGQFDGSFTIIKISHLSGSNFDDSFPFSDAPPGSGWVLDWDGGAGTDLLTLDFGYSNFRFVLNGDGTIDSNVGTFANFERFNIRTREGSYIVGGDLDDVLIGGGTFYGKGGDDTIVGTYVSGGDGDDDLTAPTISYEDASSGVTVTIKTGAQDTVGAGVDTLHSTKNLIGSSYDDILTGDDLANTIDGDAGDDVLAGRGGVDLLTYARSTAGVTVSLALTTAQDTVGAGIDTISGLENLTGSAFNDVLGGDSLNNIMTAVMATTK